MTKRSLNSVMSEDSTSATPSRRQQFSRECRLINGSSSKKACKTNWELFSFGSNFTEISLPSRNITVIGTCLTKSIYVNKISLFTLGLGSNCTEALRAQKTGTTKTMDLHIPGIPKIKFSKSDAWNTECDYQVQAMYPVANQKNRYHIAYEGWDAQNIEQEVVHSLRQWGQEGRICQIRTNFLSALDKVLDHKKTDIIHNQKFLCPSFLNDSTHTFWIYEDLSYFHTQLQKYQGMGPVLYLCLEENQVNPPTCTLLTSNILIGSTMDHILRQEYNRPISDLRKRWDLIKPAEEYQHCKNCKCNEIFDILYCDGHVKNLQPDSNGRIDLSQVSLNQRKIVIECSDQCGCSSNCPRRQSQKGQQKALVINYEGPEKGFGVRVAENIKKGEYICDYNGEVFHQNISKNSDEYPRLAADSSYDMGFSVIDKSLVISARYAGNVSRYINHNCSPNAMFIETHSRVLEDQPLIPKVAVYATEDLFVGQEISVAYWEIKEYPSTSDIRCMCKSSNCVKWLPGKVVDDDE